MPVIYEKKRRKREQQSGPAGIVSGDKLYHADHLLSKLADKDRDKLSKYLTHIIDNYVDKTLNGMRTGLQDIYCEYNGTVRMTEQDRLLANEWKDGRPTAPPPVNPQITKAHVEAAVAYMASVITVDSGIWTANADPHSQARANALADRMRRDADHFDHRTAIETALRSGFKSNLGACFIEWVDQPVEEAGMGNELSLYSGNLLRPADPFNLILDTRVAPGKVYCDGEFAGYITLATRVSIYDKLRAGTWTLGRTDETYDPYNESGDSGEYSVPPNCNVDNTFGDSVITLYVRIIPSAFGLGTEHGTAIWRFTLLGSARTLVDAEPLPSTYIPFAAFAFDPDTAYNVDGGLASQLLPFQRFISYIFSSYQCSLMKNIVGGVVGVTGDVFDLENMSSAAKIGGYVAAKKPDPDKPLSQDVVNLSQPINLTNIPQDIKLALDLMQQIFPTDMLKQIASLERATQYQAAATVQAGNKRNILIAGQIDSQMMAPLRQIMVDNILNNVAMLEVVDAETGKRLGTPIENFIGLNLRYLVADGMDGLDKLGAAEAMQQAFNMMLQMPAAVQDFDVYGAVNYILQKRGSNVDFNQFKRKPAPPTVLPPEQGQMAAVSSLPPAGGMPPAPLDNPVSPEALLLQQLGSGNPAGA